MASSVNSSFNVVAMAYHKDSPFRVQHVTISRQKDPVLYKNDSGLSVPLPSLPPVRVAVLVLECVEEGTKLMDPPPRAVARDHCHTLPNPGLRLCRSHRAENPSG